MLPLLVKIIRRYYYLYDIIICVAISTNLIALASRATVERMLQQLLYLAPTTAYCALLLVRTTTYLSTTSRRSEPVTHDSCDD